MVPAQVPTFDKVPGLECTATASRPEKEQPSLRDVLVILLVFQRFAISQSRDCKRKLCGRMPSELACRRPRHVVTRGVCSVAGLGIGSLSPHGVEDSRNTTPWFALLQVMQQAPTARLAHAY